MLSSSNPQPSEGSQFDVVSRGTALLFCLLTPLSRPALYLSIAALASLPGLLLGVASRCLATAGWGLWLARLETLAGGAAYIIAMTLAYEALDQKAQGRHAELRDLISSVEWPRLLQAAVLAGLVMVVLGAVWVPVAFVPLFFPRAGYYVHAERCEPLDAIKAGLLELADGRFLALLFVILPAFGIQFVLSTIPSFFQRVANVMHADNSWRLWLDMACGWALGVVLLAFVATAIADHTVDELRK